MQIIYTLLVLGVLTFILHGLWESLHIPLYKDYEALGEGWELTFIATVGDVMYVFVAVCFISFCKGDFTWLTMPAIDDYLELALVGFGVALFVEFKALALGRWGYRDSMPLLFGIGLSPLLQMMLLLPLSVFCTHQVILVLLSS